MVGSDDGLTEVLQTFGLAGLPRRRLRVDRANSHWFVATGSSSVVVRRYERPEPIASVEWELGVLGLLDRMGWPVPAPLGYHLDATGRTWCAFTYRPGRVRPLARSLRVARDEQRRRGALLAELHLATAELALPQRPTWTTRVAVGETNELAALLKPHHKHLRDVTKRLLNALESTQVELAKLAAGSRPVRLIHGDFSRWNLRFVRGQLSGLLDWEFCHLDDLVADFAWSWRGRYPEVIHGYQQVALLDEQDLALIEPIWRAWVLDVAVDIIRRTPPEQIPDFDWLLGMLDRKPEPF
jgi:Ser/Thr protein kinase RdoA (MazF antagonist)